MYAHKLGPNNAISKLQEIELSGKNSRTYVFDLYLVDMARVYKEGLEDKPLIGNNSTKEMFHSAVGLLSVSLVSMEKTTIYEALFEKSSVTLFFISRDSDCTDHIMETNREILGNQKLSDESNQYMTKLQEAFLLASSKSAEEDDAYESGTEEASEFGLVFASDISSESESDGENEEGESEDNAKDSNDTVENTEEENDCTEEYCEEKAALSSEDSCETEGPAKKCSQGYHTFLASCLERKLKMKRIFSDGGVDVCNNAISPLLGPENRIAAVCNFRVRKVDTKKRVIHITFLSVRKHLRGLGIGTRIIDIIKAPQMSGLYDAIVVHADLNATEFFARNGFSGDPLLNKQWASFAGEYINCLLMTYFPPLSFGSPAISSSKLLESIDKSIDEWLVATGNVHQMQYTLCKRLRAEVVRLQNQLLSQDSLVRVLKHEVVKQAHIIEELRCRLEKSGTSADLVALHRDTITYTMLPPPLSPNSQLSADFSDIRFRDCSGDSDHGF